MYDVMRPWFPPRVADLAIDPEDEAIYDDHDSGRTDYYCWYRWAATIVRPVTVLEIGVRRGYSGWAMGLDGVSQTFVGLDNESYIAGSNQQAEALLAGRYDQVMLHRVDTRTIDSFRPYLKDLTPDLIHVDGDHSCAQCLRDLQMAHEVLRVGGALLVDDASLGKEPGDACQEFLRQHATSYGVMILNDAFSYRGHHIMVRLT